MCSRPLPYCNTGCGSIIPGATLVNRTYVDQLFQWWDGAGAPLELPPGAAYAAEWRDATSLVVRFGEGFENATKARPCCALTGCTHTHTLAYSRTRASTEHAHALANQVVEPAEVSIKLAAGLRTRAQVSLPSMDRARIAGDFGSHVPPSVVAFSARDVSSAGYGYTR